MERATSYAVCISEKAKRPEGQPWSHWHAARLGHGDYVSLLLSPVFWALAAARNCSLVRTEPIQPTSQLPGMPETRVAQ